MQMTFALVLVSLLGAVWLAAAYQAYRNKKYQLSLVALGLTPIGVGVYWLLDKPDAGPAAYVVLMVANSLMWRLANK
jgi:hypothetical protein